MAKIQTDKQRKLVKLIAENVGLSKPKTLMQMMLEAGYAEDTARQQSGILNGIREEQGQHPRLHRRDARRTRPKAPQSRRLK